MTRLLVVLALACAALLPQAVDSKPHPATVDEAIDAGVAWLLRAQEPDGSWPGPEPTLYRGMTSLAGYTIIKCGRGPDHPAVRAAVASLRGWPVERTYDSGCALMLLQAMGDKRPKECLQPIADRLLATISNGRRSRGSRWGYPNDHAGKDDGHTDLSNTQYAILGLRAARLAGYKAGSPAFWEGVAKDTLEWQDAYGGFGYETGDRPSASMTVAGVTILDVCEEALDPSIDPWLASKIKAGIERGFRWLDEHWTVEHVVDLRFKDPRNDRWLDYYLYSLERMGAFTERDLVGRHDWYAEGSAKLLERRKDSHWGAGDADTCFALLFLRRGSRVSGPSEQARRLAAAAENAAIQVAMGAENPLSAWVRAAGPALRAQLDEGATIKTFSWRLDGVDVLTVAAPSVADLSSDKCRLLQPMGVNGSHDLVARVEMSKKDGSAGPTLESNRLAFVVDDVEEPWHREAIRDQKLNLLTGAHAVATSSTSLDATRPPSFAVDGQYGTSWVSGRTEMEPWIRIEIAAGVRANVLKLASASNAGAKDDSLARPRDVEVSINGGEPMALRLFDAVRRKQSVRFDTKSVRTVQIRIKSVYPGRIETNAAGFKEVELQEVLPADFAAEWLCPDKRFEIVLPWARNDAVKWRYTFEAPREDWMASTFSDAFWKEAEGGFGTAKNVLPPPRTAWKTKEIWIRRSFTLPKDPGGELRIEINHDDDAEVFINGVLAAEAKKFSFGGYVSLPVSDAARAAMRSGPNVIAAHCTNGPGACYLDVGLVRLVPSR